MSVTIKSKYKAERRLGVNMWGLKKSAFDKRPYPPGQHGLVQKRARMSDYGTHLAAKQLLRHYYGGLSEKQFRNVFKKADRSQGNTADNFVILLESRLDSLVYRASARSLSVFGARQAVSHGHFAVNGQRVTVPSYVCKNDDKIELCKGSRNKICFSQMFSKENKSKHNEELGIPSYITMSYDDKGFVYTVPKAYEISYPFEVDTGLIVEYYSA